MVGEVMNIIGDLIGTTLGLARNRGLLIEDKIVRVDGGYYVTEM